MTPTTIIQDALQSIPPRFRAGMLIAYALVGIGVAVLAIFEAELPYDKINQALVLIGSYLGVQSVANIHKEE